MTIPLTAEDQAEADNMLAELINRGYKQVGQRKHLTVGARVRHVGEQYDEAYENGTGNIYGITVRRENDVELVVVRDEPRFSGGSRIAGLANYHVQVIR
ncbi:hypothetical protein [Paractinoplanes maris]|uniref:hypothetical protein n=1 Tax=Paractinoplanes maris TaxID=1734446 RepID=UPI0020212341|nr:hypothetical protein [Actinoplanes maris]